MSVSRSRRGLPENVPMVGTATAVTSSRWASPSALAAAQPRQNSHDTTSAEPCMCGTGGKNRPFHHSIPTPASASGRANGCRRSRRSPHGVATTRRHDDEHEHGRLDEPEAPVRAQAFLPEDPVEQGHGRPRVLPDEQVHGHHDDQRRRGDAAHGGEQPPDPFVSRCLAEPEAGEVPADEHEQGVRRALEPEDVGVGADDEHDGDGAQHHARLDRPRGQGPGEAAAQGGPGAVGCRSAPAGCRVPGIRGRRRFQRLEVAKREQVPVRRQVPEVVLDVQRGLDVGQRVAAEGGEGVLRRDGIQPEECGIPFAQRPGRGRGLGGVPRPCRRAR